MCGRWYLQMFLLRDGLLTLYNKHGKQVFLKEAEPSRTSWWDLRKEIPLLREVETFIDTSVAG